jgi:hypothetical protein
MFGLSSTVSAELAVAFRFATAASLLCETFSVFTGSQKRPNITENLNLQEHYIDNLKSHVLKLVSF